MFAATRRSFIGLGRLGSGRQFNLTKMANIHVGETLPEVTVFESSPGNKLAVAEQLHGKKSILIGVPGAFSPGCSSSHVPGYITHLPEFKKLGYENFFVIAVNDPFVTKAWKEDLDAPEEFRFIADSACEFTESLDLQFDASKIFGNERSKRYVLLIDEQGKVSNMFVEPDNVSIKVSAAENVLKNA